MTAFESGLGPCALLQDPMVSQASSLDGMEEAFDALIAPAAITPATRATYFALWRTLVTFAYAYGALNELIPLSARLLKAFILSALLCGYRPQSIISFVSAFKHRHKLAGVHFPIANDTIRDWIKALKRNRGLPRTPKFKILPFHLKCSLMMEIDKLCVLRDLMIVTVGTVCAMRVSEVCDLDVCDLSWNHDGPGTLMLRIKRRKNDPNKEGLFPRIGKANEPTYDIVRLLDMMLRWGSLGRSELCTKSANPTISCGQCGPLFRRMKPCGTAFRNTEDSTARVAKSTIKNAVARILIRIGVDPTPYSGVSMRKGGVSAAVLANIPADLRSVQTGHRSDAWKHYVDLADQQELYSFFRAFGL